MTNIGIVSKGRIFFKTLQYLKKRNLKILYDKDKRSLSGKIKGMEYVSINLLHARYIIDLLSANILSVGISGLDLLADEIPSKRNKIKVIKRLDFGVARIMAIVPQAFCDVNTCADLESISEELNYLSTVKPGIASFGKALVIGNDNDIDKLNVGTFSLSGGIVESTSDEINILKGVDLSTDFTLIEKWLQGVSAGIPQGAKVVTTTANNEVTKLTINQIKTNLIIGKDDVNPILFGSSVAFGSNFIKTELNLDGYMTFKERDGSYIPEELDEGYLTLYNKENDLYVKYYDSTK